MNYQYSDAGRRRWGFAQEKRDCTVRAVALSANLTYLDAWHRLRKAGRVSGRGFYLEEWLKSAPWINGLFFKVDFEPFKPVMSHGVPISTKATYTTARFSVAFPTGSYLVFTRAHAYAQINGVVYDTWPHPKTQVLAVWKFEPESTT
jgi:hypothetical protein